MGITGTHLKLYTISPVCVYIYFGGVEEGDRSLAFNGFSKELHDPKKVNNHYRNYEIMVS